MNKSNASYYIENMVCSGCESILEDELSKLKGILYVQAIFKEKKLIIEYDSDLITLKQIENQIVKTGYKFIKTKNNLSNKNRDVKDIVILILIVIIVSYLINVSGLLRLFDRFPIATTNTSYAALFIIGLLTSVHCVAMCGGINISQSMSNKKNNIVIGKFATFKPSILYNLGRVISYTLIGGVIGLVGSVLSFSAVTSGIIMATAGVFMLIMGLNLLNIFSWTNTIAPKMPKSIRRYFNKHEHGPFVVGLINGFMPCGPLQAMQLYALSTGSFVQGALSMFFFSLGTVPLVFLIGALSNILSAKFAKKMITVSAVIIMIMGIFMLNNGLSIAGINGFSTNNSPSTAVTYELDEENNVQNVTFNLTQNGYEDFTVKKGIPVKLNIIADENSITGCNKEVLMNEFGIEHKFVIGDNIIEFTPNKEGVFTYTCWMGMIKNRITVVE